MKAGSLEIEILTNLARVQQEMAEIKRTIGGTMDSVGGSLDKARASTERYLAGLEAEAARVGKSSAEVKKMEIAANAAAASAAGYEDLAVRIRAAGAAMEQAKVESAALAAQQTAAAEAARQAAAAETAYGSGLAALRAQINPLAAEEARLAGQIDIANQAFGRGEMGTEEYIASITHLEARMKAIEGAGRGVGVSAGQQKAAMQQLSFQIGDVSQQFALGTNPMIIFAQQGGQVVQALSMMQKEATGFIGFMGGPYGAVIMGAVMILGVLAMKLGESKKATNDLTSSLDVQKLSTYELIDAINKRADADAKAIKNSYAAEVANYNVARSIQVRTIRELELAKAMLHKAQAQTDNPFAMSDPALSAGAQVALNAYERQVKSLDEAVGKAGQDVRVKFIPILRRELVAAHDASAAAALRNDKAEAGLDERFLRGRIGLDAYRAASDRITAQRERDRASISSSANSLVDAQARAEAADTRVAKARADIDLLKQQTSKLGDAGSAAAGVLRGQLVAAYHELSSAQQAAALEKHNEAAATSAAHHAEAMGRQSGAMEVNARAGMDLANAYLEMGRSAIIAEARQKAMTDATRKGIDGEAQTRRQLAIMLTDGAVNGAKAVAQLRAENAVRGQLNAQLADGTINAGEYNDRLKEELAVLPLLKMQQAAKLKGQADAYELLTRIIETYRVALNGASQLEAQASANLALAQGHDQVEILQMEIALIGAGNEERAVTIAQLKEKQRVEKLNLSPEDQTALIAQAGKLASLEDDKNRKQEVHNRLLSEQLDILDTLDQRARTVADSLADAFGRPGEAIGKLLTDFTGYAAERERLQEKLDAQLLAAGANEDAQRQARAEFNRNAGTAEAQHYANILGAAKSFFKEGTAGYKVMTTLEKVYSALQLANMIKAMVFDKASTASSVGNSMVRGSADAAAGAAKIFSSLGPLGFPVVAAMVAVLASLGLKGLHGGGKGPTIPSAEDIQKAQGTGTVLGASDAKSDSIAKSLDLLEKHTNKNLEYSNEMVRSLRAIETNIGGLASLIARQMGVSGGMFDSSGLGLGKSTKVGGLYNGALMGGAIFGGAPLALVEIVRQIPVIGGVVNTILKALFGTTKNVTLLDQGIQFATQSVDAIVNGGIVGEIYQSVQTQTKKKFFGVTYSNKTKVSDQTSGLDNDMEKQISLLIASLRDGVVGAAKVIGIDGAEAMIDAFQVDLGKISLKGLSGDDVEKALQAEFSKIADEMAAAAVGGLSAFQKVGEGLFETLTRLAHDYQVVDVALQSVGMAFGSVGAASVGARENLIDLSGGLDAFVEKNAFFRDNFLSEAEQMAPIVAAVAKEMDSLGLAGVTTKEAFKNTVLGLDLSTEAGQAMYATLLEVAPAFLKVSDYTAKLTGTLQEVAQTAEQLAAIEKQRRSLEIALMDAQGDAAAALAAKRADELAALDPTLRALQAQVWAAQDAAAAAKSLTDAEAEAAKQAEQVASQRHALEIRLMEASGDAAGALAMKRQDELDALDESNRALQLAVYAAEDAAAANEALNAVTMTAAEIAKTRRDLEIQLVEAQGDSAEALKMRRADELAALDPVLRALQQEVWAAQDAASAVDALNAVHQTAAELAKSQRDLEIRLMDAQGDAAGVLAAKRAEELAATDDSLKGLLRLIYATEDAAAADAALNGVRQTAAEIAKTTHDLELRLMEATGDAAGALARRRADEMASMDASLKPLLAQIYATEDAATANQALADAQQAAAQAADEAAKAAAELAKQRSGLEIQLLEATGQAAEATARQRADELAAMDESLRGLQQQVWAAQDATAANQALADAQAAAAQAAEQAAAQAAELAKQRSGLEIQLLEATGQAAEATARQRAIELAAMDESLRGLQQQVWAAQDATAANQALADAQAAAAQAAEQAATQAAELAKQRSGLEIDLLRAMGRETEAVAAQRALELAAIDDSLKGLQQQVWAAQDATAAQQALADAQAEAARTAEQAAAAQQALADKRNDLEIALLRATGNEIEAVARERARELAQLDPTLRGLQEQVWAAQDATAAMAAAAQAQDAAAQAARQAAEDAAQAAQEAAQKAEEIAKQRAQLQIGLLKAMGDETGALAASRRAELEAMDASLRALQRRVWATEDLRAAYDRESSAIGDTIGKFTDFGASLREFRGSLAGTAGATGDAYRAAQARFVDTASAARMGDATGIGALQGVSQAFLEASKANAGSDFEYRRDIARVANAVDAGIFASDEAVDYAKAQLDALNHSVDGLLVLNQSVLSVHDALLALGHAGGAASLALPSSSFVGSPGTTQTDTSGIEDRLDRMTSQQEAQAYAIARNTATIAAVLTRADRGTGLAIVTDDDEPVKVEVVA